ncbi:hypothetical protein MR657_03330 [bacterium]|nr:hypothetical protein [bacterium]
MTARELFEAIGKVDDDLILDANAPVRRRPAVRVWVRRALPAAACLCVMLLGSVALGRSGLFRAGSSAPAESSAAVTYEAAPDTAGAAYGEKSLSAQADTGAGAGATRYTEQDAARILGSGDGGSAALLAHSRSELYFSDGLLGEDDTALPTALPVYRCTVDSLREDAMMRQMERVLGALGLDPALAQSAVLGSTYAGGLDALEDIAAQLSEDDAILNVFWSGAAQLTLEVPAGERWPEGLRIQVSNDGYATVLAGSSGEVRTFASGEEEQQAADAIRDQYGDVLTALLGEGYTDQTDGGDLNIYGEASPLFVRFAASPWQYVTVSLQEDGTLSALHLTDRPVEEAGRCAVISRDAAQELLAAGEFLPNGSDVTGAQAAALAADPETLACVRLVYPNGRAAWLVPCWEFVVDTGAAPLGEDCDQTLHQYESFCVPAVDLAAVEGYGG